MSTIMSAIKKLFGILWAIMGVGIIPLAIQQAMKEIAAKPSEENWIFWSIVIVVLMPIIAFSLITFGIFALKGEYDTIE
jgi:small neutral amino acid transporter SnatA (MarC family)